MILEELGELEIQQIRSKHKSRRRSISDEHKSKIINAKLKQSVEFKKDPTKAVVKNYKHYLKLAKQKELEKLDDLNNRVVKLCVACLKNKYLKEFGRVGFIPNRRCKECTKEKRKIVKEYRLKSAFHKSIKK